MDIDPADAAILLFLGFNLCCTGYIVGLWAGKLFRKVHSARIRAIRARLDG